MINYYEVLELDSTVAQKAVKDSFRRLVSKYHPDKNIDRSDWAEAKTKVLIAAYEILSDETARTAYDRKLASAERLPDDSTACRERLRKHMHDPGGRARLILYDLLHERPEEALANFDAAKEAFSGFDLMLHLSRKDYLDAEFLLGEECERQERLTEALRFYEHVYHEERERPIRHFFPEVVDRLWTLYTKRLVRSSPPERALFYLHSSLKLGLKKKQKAHVFKKMAECFFELGQLDKARQYLDDAFRLDSNLKGFKKIVDKLKAPL